MTERMDASGRLNIQMGDGDAAFLSFAKRIESVFKGKCLQRIDGLDQRYWDYEIEGAIVVLHSDVFAGTSLYIEDGTRNDLLRRIAASIIEPANNPVRGVSLT